MWWASPSHNKTVPFCSNYHYNTLLTVTVNLTIRDHSLHTTLTSLFTGSWLYQWYLDLRKGSFHHCLNCKCLSLNIASIILHDNALGVYFHHGKCSSTYKASESSPEVNLVGRLLTPHRHVLPPFGYHCTMPPAHPQNSNTGCSRCITLSTCVWLVSDGLHS